LDIPGSFREKNPYPGKPKPYMFMAKSYMLGHFAAM
jgi:hypothetical protein